MPESWQLYSKLTETVTLARHILHNFGPTTSPSALMAQLQLKTCSPEEHQAESARCTKSRTELLINVSPDAGLLEHRNSSSRGHNDQLQVSPLLNRHRLAIILPISNQCLEGTLFPQKLHQLWPYLPSDLHWKDGGQVRPNHHQDQWSTKPAFNSATSWTIPNVDLCSFKASLIGF